MKAFQVLFVGAVILSALSVALGSSVKSDYQKDFDFSRLRTFNFKTERAGNDPLVTNTIEANRIQNALAAQLQMNGFTESQDNPDFIVAFYSRTRERTQVQNFGYGPGFGWGYRPTSSTPRRRSSSGVVLCKTPSTGLVKQKSKPIAQRKIWSS